MFAQMTQPSVGIAAWTSGEWILVMSSFFAGLGGLITAWRAGNKANEAKQDAAIAVKVSDINDKRIGRQANALHAALTNAPPPTTPVMPVDLEDRT